MLKDSMTREGDVLFKWRSYIPLILIPLLGYEMASYRYPLETARWGLILEGLCYLVSFSGLGVRLLVSGYAPSGTSGRNTRDQKASTLNTKGPYSLCRNPLYFGNYLILLGIVLFFHSLWLTLFFTVLYILYYERIIMREEQFLAGTFGAEYKEWAARTPAALPRLRGWQWPAESFAARRAILREYSAFFAIIVVLTGQATLADLVVTRGLILQPARLGLLLGGLVIYLALRQWKKRRRRAYKALAQQAAGADAAAPEGLEAPDNDASLLHH